MRTECCFCFSVFFQMANHRYFSKGSCLTIHTWHVLKKNKEIIPAIILHLNAIWWPAVFFSRYMKFKEEGEGHCHREMENWRLSRSPSLSFASILHFLLYQEIWRYMKFEKDVVAWVKKNLIRIKDFGI